jgi:hypothetical protein
MGYRVEVSSRADSQLAELDPIIGASIERKIVWLAENASVDEDAAKKLQLPVIDVITMSSASHAKHAELRRACQGRSLGVGGSAFQHFISHTYQYI